MVFKGVGNRRQMGMTYQMKEALQGGIWCGRLYEYGPCYDHKIQKIHIIKEKEYEQRRYCNTLKFWDI
jgi:hypothetical protein